MAGYFNALLHLNTIKVSQLEIIDFPFYVYFCIPQGLNKNRRALEL